MGPEVEATHVDDGTLRLESKGAVENVGPTLRPWPLRSAGVVDADSISKKMRGVSLVYDPDARANVTIRHAGPVGFLASKADGFATRHDDKDGYDISWWCLHAAPDPVGVAELVISRPAFREPYFQECVATLIDAFEAPDFPGPVGFAREERAPGEDDEQRVAEDRNRAYLAVSQVLEILKGNLWA